jgi:hypothetical protein
VFAKYSGDRFHICSPPRPVQRKQRLSGISQGVGDRQADAPIPHIEGQNARDRRGILLFRLGRLGNR